MRFFYSICLMNVITLAELSADLDKIVDQIIEAGIPMEVIWKSHKIKITLADYTPKLERLTKRTGVINGDPEDIVHCDWLQMLQSPS